MSNILEILPADQVVEMTDTVYSNNCIMAMAHTLMEEHGPATSDEKRSLVVFNHAQIAQAAVMRYGDTEQGYRALGRAMLWAINLPSGNEKRHTEAEVFCFAEALESHHHKQKREAEAAVAAITEART